MLIPEKEHFWPSPDWFTAQVHLRTPPSSSRRGCEFPEVIPPWLFILQSHVCSLPQLGDVSSTQAKRVLSDEVRGLTISQKVLLLLLLLLLLMLLMLMLLLPLPLLVLLLLLLILRVLLLLPLVLTPPVSHSRIALRPCLGLGQKLAIRSGGRRRIGHAARRLRHRHRCAAGGRTRDHADPVRTEHAGDAEERLWTPRFHLPCHVTVL